MNSAQALNQLVSINRLADSSVSKAEAFRKAIAFKGKAIGSTEWRILKRTEEYQGTTTI